MRRLALLPLYVSLFLLGAPCALGWVGDESIALHKGAIVTAWEDEGQSETVLLVARFDLTGGQLAAREFRRAPLADLGGGVTIVSTDDRLLLVWREKFSLLAIFLTDELLADGEPFSVVEGPSSAETVPGRLSSTWDGERVILLWKDAVSGIEAATVSPKGAVERLGSILPLPPRDHYLDVDVAPTLDGFMIGTAQTWNPKTCPDWCAIPASPLFGRFGRKGSLMQLQLEPHSFLLERAAVARGARTVLAVWPDHGGVKIRISDAATGSTVQERFVARWSRPRFVEAGWTGSEYVIVFSYWWKSDRVGIVRVGESGNLIGNPRSFPSSPGRREAIPVAGDVLIARPFGYGPLDSRLLREIAELPPPPDRPSSVEWRRDRLELEVRWSRVAGAEAYRIEVLSFDGSWRELATVWDVDSYRVTTWEGFRAVRVLAIGEGGVSEPFERWPGGRRRISVH
jgi:hypothetical protein